MTRHSKREALLYLANVLPAMNASEDKPWVESHMAMLELDPQSLPERIAVAKKAVQ